MKPVPSHVPAVGKPKALKIPPFAERRLRNGLKVLAVRRPSVPRVELRLRIPAGHVADRGDAARAYVLPETLLGGTAERSASDIARELQSLGATLSCASDEDDLHVNGGTLTGTLDRYLQLVAGVVAAPAFPKDEIAIARDRVAQDVLIALSQPAVVAGQAMSARLFGRHPYARPLPAPDAVRRVGRAAVERLHGERVVPKGSTLVLVGDLQPERAIDLVEGAFARWKSRAKPLDVPRAPEPPAGSPVLLVDRPGFVQTQIAFAGGALPRGHEGYPSLALASMVLGGYFASRLFKNVREEKGYTYGIGTRVEHRRGGSTVQLTTAVANAVTLPALVEIRYELGRIASVPVGADELDAARRYLTGTMALQVQTQAGFASYVDTLLAGGAGLEYLRSFPAALAKVTVEDVMAAASSFFAPRKLVGVLVGDAAEVASSVETLEPLETSA